MRNVAIQIQSNAFGHLYSPSQDSRCRVAASAPAHHLSRKSAAASCRSFLVACYLQCARHQPLSGSTLLSACRSAIGKVTVCFPVSTNLMSITENHLHIHTRLINA